MEFINNNSENQNETETLVPLSNISFVINLAINELTDNKLAILENIGNINTYGISSPTLIQQLNNNKLNMKPLLDYCKIIDYVDCIHDFRSCNKNIEKILNIDNINLCITKNINVDKSHEIQSYCINEMINYLPASILNVFFTALPRKKKLILQK
jgi:hypothetical protein